MNAKTKTYKKDELTIHWNSNKCIHAGECVKNAVKVFKPKERPWVQVEEDTEEVIMKAIDKCPSGALSYTHGDETPEIKDTSNGQVEASIVKGGPLMLKGKINLSLGDGREVEREGTTAFCRCGQSHNAPFCDGTHQSTEFKA